jgi:hypothetical protein
LLVFQASGAGPLLWNVRRHQVVSVSEISTSQQFVAARPECLGMFLLIAAVAHGVAFFGCPTIIVPPRISRQLLTIGEAVVVLLVPFVSSLFLLFRYRTLSERVIAWGSLAVSLFWLALAWSLIERALEGP